MSNQRQKRFIPGPAGNFNSSPSATQSQIIGFASQSGDPQNSLKRKAQSDVERDQKLEIAGRKKSILESGIRKYARFLKKSNAWRIARETIGDERLDTIETIDSIYNKTDKYQVKHILLYIQNLTLKPASSLEASSCLFSDCSGEIKATLDKSFVDLIGIDELLAGAVVELENVSILRLGHRSHLVLCDYHLRTLFKPNGEKMIFTQMEFPLKETLDESEKNNNIDICNHKKRLTLKDIEKYKIAEQTESTPKDTHIYQEKEFDENDLNELLQGLDEFEDDCF